MMDKNSFIRLAFAVHRVADALFQKGKDSRQGEAAQAAQDLKNTANTILANLLLFCDQETTKQEKKIGILLELKRQIDLLLVYLSDAKKTDWMNPENFTALESEYGKIKDFLAICEGMGEVRGIGAAQDAPTAKPAKEERMPSNAMPQQEALAGQAEQKGKITSQVFPVERKREGDEQQANFVLTQRQKKILGFLEAKANAQVWELQRFLPEVTKRTLRRDLDELLRKNLVERKGAWNSVSYELK